MAQLCQSPLIRTVAENILGQGAFLVRSILFDKSPGANWKVPWHQDLTIAVREKKDVPGFGPWSVKDGVIHVQPPAWVLERVITLRLHLDDCDESNGALKVLPGSHCQGKLGADQIQALRQQSLAVLCPVSKGGMLLMRPLLLHASSPATHPTHRRVIHLEFAAEPLPVGLDWAESAK